MTNRLLALLLLFAALGYGSLAILFPRYDTSAKWHFQMDRNQLIERAKAFAAKQGIDVSGWDVGVVPERERNHEQYLHDHQATAFESTLLSPIKGVLKFRDPRENRSVKFTFASNGQMLSFDRVGFKPNEAEKNTPPDKALAEQAIMDLVGESRSLLRFSSESEPEKGRRQLVWSYVSPNEPGLKFDFESSVTGTMLTRLEVKNSLPPAYREELSRRSLASFAVLGGLELVFNVLSVLGALVLYFLCLNRKELDHLGTLIFFGLSLIVILVEMGITTALDEYKTGAFQIVGVTNPAVLNLMPYVLYIIICVLLALLLSTLWASGEATQAKYQTGRLSLFASALRGKLFTSAVVNSVTAGVLLGGVIAAIPFLTAWAGRFSTVPSDYIGRHTTFTSSWPAVAAILNSLIGGEFYYLLLLFAFLFPVLRAYVPSQWLGRILFALMGVIFIIDLNPNQTSSILAKVFVGVAWLLVFVWLYWRFDLLAILAANFAAGTAIKGLGLYLQQSPTLHSAGIKALIALGIVMLIALVLTRFAPEREVEPRLLLSGFEDQAERERLKAEFNVARKAQENLLPASSPNVPGFGIAAMCRPARECGGDLYDFIPIRDGKIGIVVADVSGKGVPAALYMTLTKGLLLSVAENSSNPGEILREVNKHLYEVCKRKTFVTLFLGILDPATKTLTYCRAGHNPPVWRKQSEQMTKWLKPAGIGLGLNAGKSFDRVLAVEQIQLSRDDLLIFYSDGITEAMNEQQEEYGEERLETVAAMTDGMGAEESLSAIFVNVSNFLGKMLPQDDQTLVVVRVS